MQLFRHLIIFMVLAFSFANSSVAFSNIQYVPVLDVDVPKVEFSLALENNNVVLNWGQLEQIQSVLIERSADDIHFEPLFQQFKQSNRSSFVDNISKESIKSSKLYYRLTVQFSNGERVTTNSKSILIEEVSDFKPKVFVSGGTVNIQFHSNQSRPASLRIFNSTTGLVKEVEFVTNRGENSQTVSVYGVRSGMYFLQIEQTGNRATTKFFIQ